MNLLIKAIEDLKIENNPLNQHSTLQMDEATKKTYLLLLLRVIINEQGTLSKKQSRLFEMMLTRINISENIASLFFKFNQAETALQVKEQIQSIGRLGLAQTFLLEALVFIRIETPLNEKQKESLSYLADIWGIEHKVFEILVNYACFLLGINGITQQQIVESYRIVDPERLGLFKSLLKGRDNLTHNHLCDDYPPIIDECINYVNQVLSDIPGPIAVKLPIQTRSSTLK